MENQECTGEQIKQMIIESLATVRQSSCDEIHAEMRANNGDIDIKAKEEAAIVAMIEDRLQCGALLEPKDIGKDRRQANSCLSPLEGVTIARLRDIILAKISGR